MDSLVGLCALLLFLIFLVIALRQFVKMYEHVDITCKGSIVVKKVYF